MRILLIGEYSNVHWTLSEGLRELGHEVCVVSDGDSWKDYRRDINLKRESTGLVDSVRYYLRAVRLMGRLKGYDIVQLINPMFLELRADRLRMFYDQLRRNNRKMVLGAFGMDYYYVSTCLDCKTFRYSDFNFGKRQRTEEPFNKHFMDEWLGEKKALNVQIANDCDAIVSGLCEYDMCYRQVFPDKTTFIPFPIKPGKDKESGPVTGRPVRIFIGIQKTRSAYKGTDIMLRALDRVKERHPDKMEIVKVESVPFDQYRRLMDSSDIIIDQLYSYTPAMNALQAMSQGLIVVGGAEPENYSILGETQLRPIVNVLPDEEDCFNKIERLVLHPEQIPLLKRDSVEYIRRHHDYIKVAKRYSDLYSQLLA